MALFAPLTPEHYAENHPDTWQVVKLANRQWSLTDKNGWPFQCYPTKKEAEANRTEGFYVKLYNTEVDWMNGGHGMNGWKPYAQVLEEHARHEAWLADRAAAKAGV